MTIRRAVGAAILCGSTLAAFAAGLGTWKDHTSTRAVRSVVHLGGTVWAATSGGLFRWQPATGTFGTLTTTDGLQSIDITAVAADRDGAIWAGTSTGILYRHDPANGSLRTVTDIARTSQTAKRIRAIVPSGDTLLLATDFGLSIYRLGRAEFGDTFTRFGSASSGTTTSVLSALLFDGKIWAAISDGDTVNRVAVGSLSSPNLLPPEAWTLQVVGDPGVIPRSLAIFDNHLYVGTSRGVFVSDGAGWSPLASVGSRAIVALCAAPPVLYAIAESREVLAIDQSGTATQTGPALSSSPTSMTVGSTGSPLVGTAEEGIVALAGSQWGSHYPNGPNSSQFLSVAIETDGTVWGGSGQGNGQGTYRYDGSSWKSFTRQNSALPMNEVWRVSTPASGSVWASTYGRGAVEILHGTDRIDSARVFGTNIGMVGLINDPSYLAVSNVVSDSRGNHWMTIIRPLNKNVFAVRRPNGTWVHMPAILQGTKIPTLNDSFVDRCLAVDAFDNIWAVAVESPFRGVISLQNRGVIDSTVRFLVTSAHGLPSDVVRTVVVDRDNDVWVGTDKGIGIILDPEAPFRTDGSGIARYKPLNGLTINTIAVDPLNQKWVGTTEGVVLLSPDGTQVLASYTVESTGGRLIDNDVKSIAVDPTTGTVYFGTATGLASLTTPAAAPRAAFDELTVYPNPFKIPSANSLTIDGLVANSTIKVLSVDGTLMREVKTPGGRIGYWDGKDSRGQDVPSGVYIIVGYAEDGSTVASGKVAVIRK